MFPSWLVVLRVATTLRLSEGHVNMVLNIREENETMSYQD